MTDFKLDNRTRKWLREGREAGSGQNHFLGSGCDVLTSGFVSQEKPGQHCPTHHDFSE